MKSVAAFVFAFFATVAAATEVFEYRGMCEASAAAALDADHFAVADDERNTLHLYRRGVATQVATLDVSAFLGTKPDKKSDLEGSARVGNRIYWISSHSRNRDGEAQERRQRFFATEVDMSVVPPALKPVGAAYAGLLGDLLAAPALKSFKLQHAAKLAAEAPGGLNIEGLAATPQGALLIGFRNPIVRGKALVVALVNPADVVAGRKARFDTPLLIDLGGRGIRSIERVGASYLVVAGPPADAGRFALYRWSGRAHDAPLPLRGVDFGSLRPEAMFEIAGTGAVQVLSDDGDVEADRIACADRPPAQQAFRSITVKP